MNNIGGKMKKTIEELSISPEGISIVSSVHSVIKNIVQIDLFTPKKEVVDIFREAEIDDVENSKISMDIIKLISSEDNKEISTLQNDIRKYKPEEGAENREALSVNFKIKTFLDTLEKNTNDEEKTAIQAFLYSKAKELKRILKDSSIMVNIQMKLKDKIYFELQNIFGQNPREKIQALNPPAEEKKQRKEFIDTVLYLEGKPVIFDEEKGTYTIDGITYGGDGKIYREDKNEGRVE